MESKQIELTKGKRAIVDADTFAGLNALCWRAVKSDFCWYAIHRKQLGNKTRTVKMHRQIANTPLDQVCHHKNGRSLDNRRDNLQNLYPLEHKWLHAMARHQRFIEKKNGDPDRNKDP